MSILNRLKPRILDVALPEIFDMVAKVDAEGNPLLDEDGQPMLEAKSVVIHLMTMTWAKWHEVGDSVPDVDRKSVPKITFYDERGNKKLADDVDEIRRQELMVQGARLFRRIGWAMAHAVDDEGKAHYPEMENKSLEELADIVSGFDNHVIQSIGAVLIQYEEKSRGLLKRRSNSFRKTSQ